MTVDSHQHFWNYTPEEFGWLDDSMAGLRKNFLPEDLTPEIAEVGIDGVVSVQARTSLEETNWLLEMAAAHQWILGVVGWVPLAAPGLAGILEELMATHGKLCGIREVMQGRQPGALLDPGFNDGIARLKDYGLAYDLLIYEAQLAEANVFARRHPEQLIVLDHIAKPQIRDGRRKEWEEHLRELAGLPHVYCKISGMVTEAGMDECKAESLRPFFETAVEAFTPSRLMFGSDWPVCLSRIDYRRWFDMVSEWTGSWTKAECEDFFGATARRAYKLDTMI